MAVHAMLLAVVVAQVTASASTLPPPAHESIASPPPTDHSAIFNLLQEMGFSDTCVAAALDTCAVTPQDCQLATLTEEVRLLLQDVAQAVNTTQREVRDLLQGVAQAVNTTQEVRHLLQGVAPAVNTTQEVRHLLQGVAQAVNTTQEVRHLLQSVPQAVNTTQEVRHLVQGVPQAVNTPQKQPRHCKDFLDAGDGWSGVRVIYPYPGEPDRRLAVYCNQITDGGGWTVFQRRTNSTVREDFYRTWLEYKVGFGNIGGEFWLGLNPLHALTSTGQQELRVDLADWEGGHRYAKYDSFSVGDPATMYRLQVGRYSGTAGDSLAYHQGMKFSTHDANNDALNGGSCAQRLRGAWWYKTCHLSNLNGYQYEGANTDDGKGIEWRTWRGVYSLRHTAMMVRPAH